MTIDEHIGVIEDLKSTMSICMPEPEKTEICTSLGEAIDTMRKYQKLERALDKIRAEIENHCGLEKENHCRYCSYCNNLMGIREILEIIDKYKAESEE